MRLRGFVRNDPLPDLDNASVGNSEMQTSSSDILIINASLHYPHQTVFHNLNITIPGGQFTCILGVSGIGKSSLLRMIAGLIENGSAEICLRDHSSLQNNIAYMAQQDLLMPWLSVLNNVLISARLTGASINKNSINHAKELIQQVGLQNVIDEYPANLSGGMRQRVALVRTLFANKEIILMDEPFALLDVITRLQLQELTALLLKNKTVLLITHDPREALRLGHRIHIMTGQPASLGEPIIPNGQPLREPINMEILELEKELLNKLGN